MTRYDETKPQVWHLPMRDELVPAHVVDAPKAGYIVPAAHATWVAAKLDQHGVTYRRLDAASGRTDVQAFRAGNVTLSPQSVESHQRATLEGTWSKETQDIGKGALFVPIAQPKARLAMALLEPQAPDALVAWGEFNNYFERKEYMEDYVAEEVAREMLKDPTVKAAFEQRLKDDKAFADSPQQRLEFFARRHSSWDDQYRRYPVVRVDRAPH